MSKNKRPGRPVSENPQNIIAPIKFNSSDLEEAKNVAESEGYTFSGWVKALIKKEIARINRRKRKGKRNE